MSDEKKIIIDEDWKSQVQAEKDEAAKAKSAPAQSNEPTASTGETDPEMPPASFELLLTMLATEALVALGQVPHPVTGKAQVQRNLAKYLIDMLDLLQHKTKGNLTDYEDKLLENVLHQMRMIFIQTADQPANP
jgi:hypothetical protein